MRTIVINIGETAGTATVPDKVVYAFNPNYVSIDLSDNYTGVLQLTVSDGTMSYGIEVTVFSGRAKCYISRLLQILFCDYVTMRSIAVTVTISTREGNKLTSFDILALWASLEAGYEYGYYLPIVSDRNGGRRKREIVWFTGLPFKVSLFSEEDGIHEVAPSEVSDSNISLIKNSAMDGTYLRWIDSYGFWQYYLFDTGQRQSKNKLSSIAIDAEYSVAGVNHQALRYSHVENTDTIKCCAISIKKEILAYVETIYKSPHIDLYVGKTSVGEVWKPVNIVAGSVNVSPDGKLFDYEISFTLPETQVQEI